MALLHAGSSGGDTVEPVGTGSHQVRMLALNVVKGMLHFCTYFDAKYVHRGLVLYRSLDRQGEEFTLWILCLDDETYDALVALQLPRARLIRHSDFESGDEALARARKNRKLLEYYWTCTPTVVLRIFEWEPSLEILTYLDADLAFYGKSSAILEELGSRSVLLNPQDVSDEYRLSAGSGRFNVGVNAFRRSEVSLAALRWWRERCLEDCGYSPQEGKYGDQKYLDDWPKRFPDVAVAQHVGLRLAPWNVGRHRITREGAGFRVGDVPLICFHFHGVRFCSSRLVWTAGWRTSLDAAAIEGLFRPYLRELIQARDDLRSAGHPIPIPTSGIPWRYLAGRLIRRQPVRHFIWLGRNGDKE